MEDATTADKAAPDEGARGGSSSGLNATVSNILFITDDLFLLYVVPDADASTSSDHTNSGPRPGAIKHFLPGQSLALGLPGYAPRAAHLPEETDPPKQPEKIIKRAYSIASSPEENEHYEFYIALVRQGALTPRFMCLQPGSRLFAAQKPVGTFTLESVPKGREIIFISTGTGIAPFVSMLRTTSTFERFAGFTLLHGVRYAKDLGYDEEMKQLAVSQKNFFYRPVVSREPDFVGARGHVQTFLPEGLNPEKQNVFLCGNPSMIAEVTARLSRIGYSEHSKKNPAGSLHVESYW